MCTSRLYPEIFWQGCQPQQAVTNLFIRGRFLKAGTHLHHLITEELCDLLCQLFARTQMILVEPLSHGCSGVHVLKVQPFYGERGGGRQVVVKFGALHAIEQEYENYLNSVQHFIGDGRNTTIYDRQQTLHLGGILYSLVGTDMQHIEEFGTFYHQGNVAQVKQMLDNVFRRTCGIWYANHTPLRPLNLTEDYQQQSSYTTKQFEKAVDKSLPSVSCQQQTLTFASLKSEPARHFTNPFYVLKTIQPFIRSTYVSIVHGDLNQRNILVDQSGYPWLIDFQSTGPGHILRDVAMLDSVLRFQLLSSQQATLDERLTMEEALCKIRYFSKIEQLQTGYVTENPALAKTYEAIVHLRTLARWLVEKKLVDDMSEYYIALLYTALGTLQFSSLEVRQREHALLSVSLLIDVLELSKS